MNRLKILRASVIFFLPVGCMQKDTSGTVHPRFVSGHQVSSTFCAVPLPSAVIRMHIQLAQLMAHGTCSNCIRQAAVAAGHDNDDGTGETGTFSSAAFSPAPPDWPSLIDVNLVKNTWATGTSSTNPAFNQSILVEVVLDDTNLSFFTRSSPGSKPDVHDSRVAILADNKAHKLHMFDCLKPISSDHENPSSARLNVIQFHVNGNKGGGKTIVGGLNIGVLLLDGTGNVAVPIYIDPHIQNNG